MTILLATTNPGKLREIQAVLQLPGVELVDLGSLPAIPEPVEDGDTFEANAILKARYYAAASGRWCLADDSGLEVDALGGAPGVRSARYAGIQGPRHVVDPANNARLLERLQGVPADRRTARFVCAMALADPAGTVHALVRGTFEGLILPEGESPRGVHGFGYDPLFLPDKIPGAPGRTSAELSPDEKNAISHRGDAARQMGARLAALLAAQRRG